MEEKNRSQIEEKYKWDLKTIYKDNTELLKDYNSMKKKVEKFAEKENTFLNNGENLYGCLKEYDNIAMILDKMWSFVSHRYDTDLANNENQAWKDKVYNLYEEFSQNSSFLEPKLLEFGFPQIENMYKTFPKLKEEYSFNMDEIFRASDHTLSEKEEKLISNLSKSISNTSEIASMLTDSDIDFGTITLDNGEKVKLTDTNYIFYMTSNNRQVRKEAFKTLYKTYKQFNNTLSLAFKSEIEKKITISKVRKFNNSLEAALFADNVSVDVYNNLIEVVGDNLTPLFEYYKLKQNILKLEEFHLYDVYAQIANKNNKTYTFEEAKELVLDALRVLGNDYISMLKKAFNEKWIDIYPNKGKRGGAYSGGSYLTNPFVLLNFKGTYHDVSTVAHELGHSMHSYYSIQNNPYQYSEYRIFVAEVASQVNEILLNDYMLKKVKSKEEKIDILNQTLDLFKSSIYRQTMFAEFEKEVASKCEDGEILTAEVLNNTYYNLVKKYFGPNVKVDEEIQYEWERIPHFYYNFYVYKYSTGLAAAAYIAKRILDKEDGALESYLAFLKTGGSMYPLDELKIAGVDLTDKKVIQKAMDMFKEYLDEFKKIVNS